MAHVQLAHTAHLSPDHLDACQALLLEIPDRLGHGLGGTLMEALEGVIRRAHDLGALGATDRAASFYAARGRQPWRGPTSALTPRGSERTGRRTAPSTSFRWPYRSTSTITCDWRDGDVW